MRKIFKNFLQYRLWPSLEKETVALPGRLLLKHFILQKILRINSHVHWPVHPSTHVIRPDKIDHGTRTPGLSRHCHLDGRNGITFGKNVWVGPGVKVISQNHDLNDYHSYTTDSPITIGDNCWLGANAIILPGTTLGNHVVVGAGSVVTKSFNQDNIVIAGNPARKIKDLIPYQETK